MEGLKIQTNMEIDFSQTKFLETSQTAADLNRLNWRAEMLLARNRKAVAGRQVLDLASHDGRFSYASLKLGAKKVVGVEIREHLVENSKKTFESLGLADRAEFVRDDLMTYVKKVGPGEFDTILCFGIFYHIIFQAELMAEIGRIRPKFFILDTWVTKEIVEKPVYSQQSLGGRFFSQDVGPGGVNDPRTKVKNPPILRFVVEDSGFEGNTIADSGLTAVPSESLIELLFERNGFEYQKIRWDKANISDWKSLEDYFVGKRVSFLAWPKS